MSLFSKLIKDKPLETLDKKLEKLTTSIPIKLNIQSDETIKGNIVDTVFHYEDRRGYLSRIYVCCFG